MNVIDGMEVGNALWSKTSTVDIVNFTQMNGMRLFEVGATRPVSPSCVPVVEGAGAKIVRPIKDK